MATKIETDLTPEQLEEFFRRLAQTKGGVTGPAIKALCAEFGVTISHETANGYRTGIVADYLAQLRAKSERAQQVAALAREGLSLADAASVRLSETVFDELMSGNAEALTAEERDIYSRILARARAGDQSAKKLEADLKLRDEQIAKLQAEAQEREEKAAKAKAAVAQATKKAGLGADTRRIIEEALAKELGA